MLGVYVHWPFCKKKCPYCDFNSHVRTDIDEDAFCDSLIRDMQMDARRVDKRPLHSMFFGGGTPSLMSAKSVERVIDTAQNLFSFTNDIEITLEANPTSSESQKFQDFKTAGVNRISLGVQALCDDDLQKLGREHSVREALNAVDIAKGIFSRWSFDLIYARSGQTVSQWQNELSRAVAYIGGHISLYQLTMEEGTEFKRMHDKGALILPDDDTAVEMYEITAQFLAQYGYNNYEVSNYAKDGDESRHNMVYWLYEDYIGIGAGAHGRITTKDGKFATSRIKNPEQWQAISAYSDNSRLSPIQQAEEYVIMGLRLSQGIDNKRMKKIVGCSFDDFFNYDKLQVCLEQGLLIRDKDILRTTTRGRLNLNAVLGYII